MKMQRESDPRVSSTEIETATSLSLPFPKKKPLQGTISSLLCHVTLTDTSYAAPPGPPQ